MRGDGSVGLDEQVARVRVGVEEAVLEHHGEDEVCASPGQLVPVDAGRVQGGQVVDSDAVHPFQGQHA